MKTLHNQVATTAWTPKHLIFFKGLNSIMNCILTCAELLLITVASTISTTKVNNTCMERSLN